MANMTDYAAYPVGHIVTGRFWLDNAPNDLTGDRASMDEDGYLWFVGRADDVINSASYRIGPFEVESALAFVVLAPGHTATDALVGELQDHVKTVTAPYKYPREIEFVADLPKTISGKIRRTELRDMERRRTTR